MKIVDIELVRAHCNSLPDDDVLLEYYTEVAEEMVVSETRRTDEELIAMGGGSYPTRIKQAVLLIVAHFYKVREAVSTINEILTPFAYAACVKPFRKFATDWKNEDNDMYNGIIKGETGLFVNLDISEVNSNRQQSIGLSLKIQDISGASAEADGLVTAYDAQKELKKKQDTLVSGKNLKTVGGESLLGSGEIDLGGFVSNVVIGEGYGSYVPEGGVLRLPNFVQSIKTAFGDTIQPNANGIATLPLYVRAMMFNGVPSTPTSGGELVINAVTDIKVGGVSVVKNGVANFGTAVNAIVVNGQQAPNAGGVINLGSTPYQTDNDGVRFGTHLEKTMLDGRDVTIGNIVNFPQVAILGTGFNVNTRNVNIGTDTTGSVTVSAKENISLLGNRVVLGTVGIGVNDAKFYAPNIICSGLVSAQKSEVQTLYLGGEDGGPTAEIKLASTSDKITITCNGKSAEIPLS